jgi:hypothetical protein
VVEEAAIVEVVDDDTEQKAATRDPPTTDAFGEASCCEIAERRGIISKDCRLFLF